VTLHYVEAGSGPLVVLLHGFPEFSFGWRLQIRTASRRTAPTRSPTTSPVSSTSSVTTRQRSSGTIGAGPSPGRWR
jgi:hypothetical protein